MLTRRILLTGALAVFALPVLAQTPPVFAQDGIAIKGADPVAYFTKGAAVLGVPEHSFAWNGAVWYFSNAQNKAAFAAAPETYAPQYGGYCAYAVSRNYTAKIDPEAWRIVDGKLYLNYSRSVAALWRAQMRKNIRKADANWPGVLN